MGERRLWGDRFAHGLCFTFTFRALKLRRIVTHEIENVYEFRTKIQLDGVIIYQLQFFPGCALTLTIRHFTCDAVT